MNSTNAHLVCVQTVCLGDLNVLCSTALLDAASACGNEISGRCSITHGIM
jgi:hypothetical protein